MAAALDYNSVVSLSAEEFKARTRRSCAPEDLGDERKFTKADRGEIAKVERLLDVRPGTLSGEGFYLGRLQCANCSRLLTAYDFVFTGLVDAGHSKSLILHTLVGSKFVVNPPRQIRCSACGVISAESDIY